MSDSSIAVLLARAWAVLPTPVNQAFNSFQMGDGSLASSRVAIDRNGLRHLLVPVGNDVAFADQRSSVLSCDVRELRFDGVVGTFVDIRCDDPDLNAEFDEVVEDLIEAAEDSAHPGSAVLSGLARWRRLFRAAFVRGLGPQARLGLFGELTVLSELVKAESNLPVDVWTGPFGGVHDFEAPNRCLEVKAVGVDRAPVRINGVAQLDTHDDKRLELLLLTVVSDPSGITLSDLVARVRSKVVETVEFDRRLRRVGWQPGPAGTDQEAFVVAETFRVPVTEEIPRLVPAGLVGGCLPDDVSDVSYRVRFDALSDHAAAGTLEEIAHEAVR